MAFSGLIPITKKVIQFLLLFTSSPLHPTHSVASYFADYVYSVSVTCNRHQIVFWQYIVKEVAASELKYNIFYLVYLIANLTEKSPVLIIRKY